MAMKKRRRIKKSALLVIVILVILVGTIVIKRVFFDKEKATTTEVVDEIKDYGYILNDNETKYYQKLFKELKKELDKPDIDEEEYAKLLSQLFVADFFNLDNKENKNDIGGTQFIYTSFQQDFEKLAKDGIYKTVENNMYSNRNQELPIVTDTEVTNVETTSYDYLDSNDSNAYIITVAITYKKDLEYQDECTLTIVHSNNKLEIVKMI